MIQDEQVRQDQRYSRLPQLVLQKLERMEELGLPQEKVQRVEQGTGRSPTFAAG